MTKKILSEIPLIEPCWKERQFQKYKISVHINFIKGRWRKTFSTFPTNMAFMVAVEQFTR